MKKYNNERFNDTLARALNKKFGFPEDYTGRIEGFESTIPVACEIFGATSAVEIKGENNVN